MQTSSAIAFRALPGAPVDRGPGAWAGLILLALMFLAVAFWNGFPLIFYDTGAYLLEGLGGVFLVERAPVYSEFLFLTGGGISLWPVVAIQALITAYLVLETARLEVPDLTLKGLLAIGAVLTLVTGMGWYVGQVEPDCMTPMVVLGSWLLLFRSTRLSKARLWLVTLLTALAVACHPSHLGLVGGLLMVAAVLRLLARRFAFLPAPRLRAGLLGLAASLALIVAGNFALTGTIFISRSGSVFIFARLMQDGIVKRLLDETCPESGYKLCDYKNRLATRADAWLWGENTAFHSLGGFSGQAQQEEDRRIIIDSLMRYPWMHIRAAAVDSVDQFLMFKTGDGIEPQIWIEAPGFRRMIPHQLHAYLGARQQRGLLRFKTLNLLHVPMGALSILAALLLIQHAAARRRWGEGAFPAVVLVALMGNAIICGTFSNPHDRYQSRVIWLPTFALLLALARDRRALQPVPESGT